MHRLLAVIGDYYHPESVIAEGLEESLASWLASGKVNLTYTTVDRLAKALQDKPDAVILFKDDKINPADENPIHWLDPETEQAMLQYVYEGGGWLSWHSGLASYPEDGAYVSMTRGYFKYHPEQKRVRFEPVAVSASGEHVAIHPSLSFESVEEHYFVYCDESNTNVFMRSFSEDGESIGGWSHSYGKGRVCCLTPAHNHHSLILPEMKQVVDACVRWCARA
ncbi:ThuA domain-containing protein [Paenibacillus glycanilyticus]|uniref:ThuA domain-containing protein n=1 Tax=Paenibacillus glycanilyticus TaxID=126569 RepID=UPI00203C5A57|nr:ThuA domain-containing protein [Paenibacillus glycanilyticus]MCM3625806.1 ThuA domain-containing protein [Paenibacillus glycanilyticus]